MGIAASLLVVPPALETDADEVLEVKRNDNDKIKVIYLFSNQNAHRVSDNLRRKPVRSVADLL